MFFIQIKLLIIAGFIGTFLIFFWQNSQVVSLVLFGSITVNLPVGILILGAVFSGILTSVILQLLNPTKMQMSPPVSPPQTNRNNPNYSRSPRPKNPEKAPVRPSYQPPKAAPVTDFIDYDNQDIRDQPKNEIKDNINKPISEQEKVDNRQDKVKNSTVYSYSYPQDRAKVVNKKDDVYDANYRVIKPPSQPNESSSLDDEEDWV